MFGKIRQEYDWRAAASNYSTQRRPRSKSHIVGQERAKTISLMNSCPLRALVKQSLGAFA